MKVSQWWRYPQGSLWVERWPMAKVNTLCLFIMQKHTRPASVADNKNLLVRLTMTCKLCVQMCIHTLSQFKKKKKNHGSTLRQKSLIWNFSFEFNYLLDKTCSEMHPSFDRGRLGTLTLVCLVCERGMPIVSLSSCLVMIWNRHVTFDRKLSSRNKIKNLKAAEKIFVKFSSLWC